MTKVSNVLNINVSCNSYKTSLEYDLHYIDLFLSSNMFKQFSYNITTVWKTKQKVVRTSRIPLSIDYLANKLKVCQSNYQSDRDTL